MAYRSLLVLLDRDPLCAVRTQVAIRLARNLDCHRAEVAPTGLIDFPVSPEAATSFANFTTPAWDTLRDQAERATDRSRDECARWASSPVKRSSTKPTRRCR